jgi:hypothetical protein
VIWRFFANLLLRRLLTRLRFSDKAGNHDLSSADGYDIVGNDLRSTDHLGRSEVVPSGTQRWKGKSSDCVRLCHGYRRLVWANESLNCHLGHRFTRVRIPNPALEWISHCFAILSARPVPGPCRRCVLVAYAHAHKKHKESQDSACDGDQSCKEEHYSSHARGEVACLPVAKNRTGHTKKAECSSDNANDYGHCRYLRPSGERVKAIRGVNEFNKDFATVYSSMYENTGMIPDLHDGFFDGVWLSPDKGARFFVRTKAGERATIVLSGVEALNVCGIRAGNIVFECVVIASDKLTLKHIEDTHDLKEDQVEVSGRLLSEAQRRGLSGLEINSSYGAEGIVLFRAIDTVREHVLA